MFQVLDEKKHCVGVYKDGEISYKKLPDNLDKTWNYAEFLRGQDIDYAYIFSEGKTLDEACPQEINLHWKKINDKMRSHLSAALESKISLKENCFFDLVPQRFLKEYCELKNRICEHVFSTTKKPQEYTFFREFGELISDISNRDLCIDRARLMERIYLPQAKSLLDKVNSGNTKVKYNMFNSVTGRLTVTENSFPILNLNSKFRDIVKPTNDWFVSVDLNAAEIRMAIALSGQAQPAGDLHEAALKTVFNEEVTRTQAKNITMQWMYDSQSDLCKKYDAALSKFYNKPKLVLDYWKDGYVHTPYGRKIEADRHHIISYLNQSSLIDMWHRQMLKAVKKLDGKKSFLAFLVHDQAIFDLHDSEKNLLPELISELSNTPYGKFPVKVEIGTDFMNTKKVNIKV